MDESRIHENPDEIRVLNQVPSELQSAQQKINHLRLLNVCLQSTLLRAQSQLLDFLPESRADEIKRHEIREKLAVLRRNDDHHRRRISQQHISFSRLFDNFKSVLDPMQHEPVQHEFPFEKNHKQIEILQEMFHELNTIIHTEHNDRISQLYITLAQTSQSVSKTREGTANPDTRSSIRCI